MTTQIHRITCYGCGIEIPQGALCADCWAKRAFPEPEATANPPTEQATEEGVTTERDVRNHVAAVAQGETPRIYEACLNWDNTGDYRKRLVSVEYYEQLKRELNEAKTLYAASLDTLKDMSAKVVQLIGAQDRMDAEIAMLTADLFRATSERDQARQDLEERCAENDRERAAHLQAYQEACEERDAARAKLGGAVMFGAVGGRLMTRIFEAADMSLENATDVELQLVRLLSELAELRKDRERLDWLDAEREKNAIALDGIAKRGLMKESRWAIHIQGRGFVAHQETGIRAAIDAARNQQEGRG